MDNTLTMLKARQIAAKSATEIAKHRTVVSEAAVPHAVQQGNDAVQRSDAIAQDASTTITSLASDRIVTAQDA